MTFPEPNTPEGCEECLASGDSWVHLRLCLECGHVGCCDSSPNRHATKHFRKAGHPLVASYEPGEAWVWCYEDEVLFETAASVR
ncbi:MAG TPA: UBP-type zinc finger domain-containing protein [Candidatus Dormibacteraeota bacterium]